MKESEKEEARLTAIRKAEEEEKLSRVRRLEARQKREEEERVKREAAREKRRLDREERERKAQAGVEGTWVMFWRLLRQVADIWRCFLGRTRAHRSTSSKMVIHHYLASPRPNLDGQERRPFPSRVLRPAPQQVVRERQWAKTGC
jgi:hypothetical protein